MALPVFPKLPGMTWPLTRKTIAGGNVAFEAASGAKTVVQLWKGPLYEWEVSFDGLATNARHPGLGVQSKQLFEAFFLQCGGSANPFLYNDPEDGYQAGAILGVGDGTTTTFTAQRNVGTFTETVDAILGVAAVYVNGVALSGTAWSVSAPNGVDSNAITFSTAPAPYSVILIDFWWAFKCRFTIDELDFKQIMTGLWQLDGVKFRRERA